MAPQILESELFGYVAGAFTGASPKGKIGLFELAHHGTIFLDEISELDKPLQTRLLRVLQERQIMRLGSDQMIPVDIRVIAATNQTLTKLIADGTFREDLYYRLNVLKVPSHDCQMLAGDYKTIRLRILRKLLEAERDNKSLVAKRLNVDRTSLTRWIRESA